jgi:hypothetical protein
MSWIAIGGPREYYEPESVDKDSPIHKVMDLLKNHYDEWEYKSDEWCISHWYEHPSGISYGSIGFDYRIRIDHKPVSMTKAEQNQFNEFIHKLYDRRYKECLVREEKEREENRKLLVERLGGDVEEED